MRRFFTRGKLETMKTKSSSKKNIRFEIETDWRHTNQPTPAHIKLMNMLFAKRKEGGQNGRGEETEP